MRANSRKRQMFEDALDLMTGVDPSAEDGVSMVPIGEITGFHDHPFRLYAGERLDDMVESIRTYGVLTPVIVREMDEGSFRYEMLAGHNRMNAAQIAGLTEIPAIVKKDLSEAEAYVYVIETNVLQRSFAELLPSEKAAVMSEHYQQICGSMKREQIVRELKELKEKKSGENLRGHYDHGIIRYDDDQLRTRDIVAEEYGFSSRNAARYLRINYLIQPFKDLLDENAISLMAAVDVSYLTEQEQEFVAKAMQKKKMKISQRVAAELRKMCGNLTEESIEDLFEVKKKEDPGVSIWITGVLRNKYFKGMSKNEMMDAIDRAMSAWLERKAV